MVAVLGASLMMIGATPASADDTVYSAAQRYAQTPIPDRVLLIPTQDPTTTQRVTWRASATNPRAQIIEAPKAFGDVMNSNPELYKITTVPAFRTSEMDPKTGYTNTYHAVEFTDLKPNTRYSYRVGDGTNPQSGGSGAALNNWTPWRDFTTAAVDLQPYSFIYFGDAQNYLDTAVPRVFSEAIADRPDARLVLHAGDLMNQTGTSDANIAVQEKEWAQWFEAGEGLFQTRSTLATPGNHEYNSSTAISRFWKPQFPFPENGPKNADGSVMEAVKQSAYYTDYQGVRYISLDSSPLQNGPVQTDVLNAQTAWFEALLSDPNRPKWTVVTFHHPVYSGTSTRNNQVVRDNWNPLLSKYGVDLVLQGHDHVYNRGNQVVDNDPVDPTVSHGPVYSIAVAGGKMYALNQGQNWTDNGAKLRSRSENTQHYQLIDVEADKLVYQSRTADGEFFDGYRIEKPGTGWDTAKRVVDLDTDPDAKPTPEPARATSTTTLELSATSGAAGSTVTATVGVSSAGAVDGAAVDIVSGETTVASAVVADGTATVEVPLAVVGSRSFVAKFAGTATTLPSDSAASTVTVHFGDVTPGNGFFEDVSWLIGSGITTGYADGTFRPTQVVERQAMAAFLFRLKNPGKADPTCTGTTRKFSDVPAGNQFCGAIEWLSSSGITTGNEDGTFRPGAPVQRQAMIAFLFRALNPGVADPTCAPGKGTFTDVSRTGEFCGVIEWAADKKIAQGWSNGTFRPGASIERQAVAAQLHRAATLTAG
ncbi:collagen-like triple helix repeat-containing protein [Nakamurella silvestris]|nr:collagen-like triple helix repeat-containing protein [Nakamurella silvestris]